MERNTFLSKKVFFLYPHSVIQQGLMQELVANEYSIYLVNDHKRFREVVRKFEEPIVFFNIDENLKAEEWENYISEMINSDDNSAMTGVLTYNDDKELAETYLMNLGVPCGFIKLKLGLEQSRGIILKTLEANEAKGRRKYLRIDCWSLQNTEINVKFGENFFTGRIKDISSVGMAVVFDMEQQLQKNMMLNDIQLKLRGKIARVSGPVIGSRETTDGIIYVVLFDQKTDSATRTRIYGFIYETLQDEINQIMQSREGPESNAE